MGYRGRPRPIRPLTVSLSRTTVAERQLVRLRLLQGPDYDRPRQRGDCEPCPTCQGWRDQQRDASPRLGSTAPPALYVLECGHDTEQAIMHSRPCCYSACRHHLYLDVSSNGSIKFTMPDLEPEQMIESCSLDVADHGGLTLEDVGVVTNLTRERVRQIEAHGLLRLKRKHGPYLRGDPVQEQEDYADTLTDDDGAVAVPILSDVRELEPRDADAADE